MYLNTVLAIIIVLIFILAFCAWVLLTGATLFAGSGNEFLGMLIPGGLFFSFWGFVAYRLYNCSAQNS